MTKLSLYSFLLAALSIVGVILLAVLGKDIPQVLELVLTATVGGALAGAHPGPTV